MNRKRKGIHQSTIDDLVDRFIGKHYVKSVEKNVNYVMGECDILVEYTDRRTAYWEIKSNHSKKSFMTAVRQLMRWSQVMNSTNPNRNYYGIYVASDDFIAVLCKNGTMLQDMNYKKVRGVPYEKNNMLNY